MCKFLFTLVLFLSSALLAYATDPVLINDPGRFSEDIMGELARGNASSASNKIVEAVGHPEQAVVVMSYMKVLDGKVMAYHKKVIDKDFNGALRQIIHYSYMKDIGFVYFRFNFKQTGSGWVLANFNFNSEIQELFPPAFKSEF